MTFIDEIFTTHVPVGRNSFVKYRLQQIYVTSVNIISGETDCYQRRKFIGMSCQPSIRVVLGVSIIQCPPSIYISLKI